ncbi:uncharacterized protein LOC130803653 [Amaranthus tricolor]|uniref:uncharacterized protein LOC130803653 n=1 Tax=Amaranthus tricolor TaxID=29722 RepID=UPI0025854AED|nr:uncharacterized protein LOC130803653 [Amaranthus tricolor]
MDTRNSRSMNLTSLLLALIFISISISVQAGDNNHVYSPCRDTKVQRDDGFSFGIAFSRSNSFYLNNNFSIQLSPCDRRLSLSGNSQLALFRPKVDEISLLTINSSSFNLDSDGTFMVAFAGSKYAARSPPVFVGNNSYVVTGFTLILEFKQGRLQNLFWKRDGCASCHGKGKSVCLKKQVCAIKRNDCKDQGGTIDCSLGIQLAFSGTDKHYTVLNSWYEVGNLRQYSLFGLYSNFRKSITDQFNKIF